MGIKYGDVVRLTQGSIKMLVLHVTGTQAICTWLDNDGDRIETSYPTSLLKVVGRLKEWFS